MVVGWISLGLIALLIIYAIWTYNSLVRLQNQVENAWAQIDVQLKRRNDLIPNLVDTVKGYADHEKDVFTQVTEARTKIQESSERGEMAKGDNMMSDALKSLFAVAEDYPDLKANENFLQLQEELSGTENKIAYSRQHYNDMVMKYNTRRETFPYNIFVSFMTFEEEEMFRAPDEEKENIDISF